MTFSGGAADKVGNEYEMWWTLRRMIQLLRGDIRAIAVEPLAAEGAELWVESRNGRTYDQVKYRSSGRWTPARLRSDGLLRKLRRHYSEGHQILLVFSTPSEELERLIGLAATTSTGDELWSHASEVSDLEILADAWTAGREEVRSFLLQTEVRHDGLADLKDYVELAVELLVIGSVQLAIGVLRRCLEDSLSLTLTAPAVWADLNAAGIMARPRFDPAPTNRKLEDALERHLRAIRRAGPRLEPIARREVREVVQAVLQPTSSVVLVVGQAGAGKSMVAASAAERLAATGRHVTALRLDRLEPSASTAEDLGASIGLQASPAVALSEVSPKGLNGVLVIDQLDAVSSYSGRMPGVFEAVDDVVHQAKVLGNVCVVLAVRQIDLEQDPRLRALAGEGARTIHIGRLDREDVRGFISQVGIEVEAVEPSTLELLRLPIHLHVFSELDIDLRSAPYVTLTSLYHAFTNTIRIRLERQGYPDEWMTVMQTLVEHMNRDEALSVTRSSLDHIRPLYVEALLSAGILVEEGRRLSVFHETYFDYLFAKSFGRRGTELVSWFIGSGQGLFRRSQLRQLLAYIATETPRAFISQVEEVANSAMRPHLISIAYSVLPEHAPQVEDWMRVRELIAASNPFALQVVNLLGIPRWFAVADHGGDVERLLDDAEWGSVVAHVVARLASNVPDRVLELLRDRRSRGPVWIEALRSALEVADSPAWGEYAVTQTELGTLDLIDRPFNALDLPLFEILITRDPSLALRMFAATVAADIEIAIAREGSAEDALSERGRHAARSEGVARLASFAPMEFVETLAPLVERAATHSSSWRFLSPGNHDHDGLGRWLLFVFDDALAKVAVDHPTLTLKVLVRFARANDPALDFLVCRAIGSISADLAVEWLLESEDHLQVGWISNSSWESRRLIESASPDCSTEVFARLEDRLLGWWPEQSFGREGLRWNGIAQLEFLTAMAFGRLSDAGRRRIAELKRKFPQWEVSEPEGVVGGAVRSPISRNSAERMTDGQWLKAIARYSTQDPLNHRGGRIVGGSSELAFMLGSLAKERPVRYLALACSLPSVTAPTYTEQVIRGLLGEVGQLDLLPLLRKYRRDHPAESGRTIASAIEHYADDLEDELFEELIGLCYEDDPTVELARVTTSGGYYFGGDLLTAGINSTRGLAANALSRVLFADSSRADAALPALWRLVDDPIAAVRTVAAEAALAYASIDRETGLDLIERVVRDEAIAHTAPAHRALRWAMLWDARRFGMYLEGALSSEDAKLAGALWANCMVNEVLGSVTADIAALSVSARIGVADALARDPGLAPDILTALFDDVDPEVRRQATRCVYFLKEIDIEARHVVIKRLAGSEAFAESAGEVIRALEGLPGRLPTIALDVCGRVVEMIASSTGGRFRHRAADLVTMLVRIYRSSDPTSREVALDLLDQTVILQLWGVDKALDDVR